MSKIVTLILPVAGKPIPLSDVHDYLFSKKIMGEGAAIEPYDGVLYAPCDGEIAAIYEAKHAIIMRTDESLEILIHVGIDTAKLDGRGFATFVKVLDRVKTGDKLLMFDKDYVEKNASTITPIVITNHELIKTIDINFSASKTSDVFMEVTLI